MKVTSESVRMADGKAATQQDTIPKPERPSMAWDLRVARTTFPEQPDFRFHYRCRGQAIRPVQGFNEMRANCARALESLQKDGEK